MKRILFFIGCLLSLCPIQADTVTSQTTAATEYSLVVGDWTYITNASEFLLLVNQCADPNVGEKKVRFACDLEFTVTNKNLKYFRGTLDGMGANIKNYKYSGTNDDVTNNLGSAFIQELKGDNSEVKNFRFENSEVSSNTSVAIVVNKVTATTASINNIYVHGGYVRSGGTGTPPAGIIACKISTGTTISNCIIYNTYFNNDLNAATNGLFFTYFTDNGPTSYQEDTSTTTYPVTNSCAVLSGVNNYHNFHFSIPDPPVTKYHGSHLHNYYYNKSINPYVDSSNANTLTSITLESLTSGEEVFNGGKWVYTKDSIPRPAGHFYWVPGEMYERTVGYGGTNIEKAYKINPDYLVKAKCTPLQYGRAFDNTPLKVDQVVNVSQIPEIDGEFHFHDAVYNSYVGNDVYTYCDDWTGKPFYNPVTVLGKDLLYDFNEAYYFALPRGVTKVEGYQFRNQIKGINNKEEFRTAGNWIYDNDNGVLYLNSDEGKYLVTSVWRKGLEEISIDGEKCDTIFVLAFTKQEKLQKLYVNTWFPVGTTEFKPIQLYGTVFATFNNRVYGDDAIKVYIKDGTQDMSIIGKTLYDGYKDYDQKNKWTEFYSEREDVPNRLFQYYPVKRNPAGLSTVMLGYPVQLPSDCKAWVAKGISDGNNGERVLTLQRVSGSIIPAKLPVLISYTETSGTIALVPYEGNAPASTLYEENLFKGSLDPGGQKMTSSENMSNFLTLSRPNGGDWSQVGFYRYTPKQVDGYYILPSYVAWLSIQDVTTSESAKLSMTFLDEEDGFFTGLIVMSGVSEQETSAPIYSLSGQRVGSNYKGIVVKNGRKYLVK